MRLFIAGANTTGHAAAQTIRLTRSSHKPCATLAMILLVAGATSIKSARSVRAICCGSALSIRSNVSVCTRLAERASKVKGAMNFCASAVMQTVTPAPSWTSLLTTSATLYAAMPPQTATITSREARVSVGMEGEADIAFTFARTQWRRPQNQLRAKQSELFSRPACRARQDALLDRVRSSTNSAARRALQARRLTNQECFAHEQLLSASAIVFHTAPYFTSSGRANPLAS